MVVHRDDARRTHRERFRKNELRIRDGARQSTLADHHFGHDRIGTPQHHQPELLVPQIRQPDGEPIKHVCL